MNSKFPLTALLLTALTALPLAALAQTKGSAVSAVSSSAVRGNFEFMLGFPRG